MHENSDNSNELEPHMVKTLDVLERKKKLLQMWDDIEFITSTILTKAKEDPSSLKASLLKEVINSMKALREIADMAEALKGELKEAEEREADLSGNTEEERRQLDEYHKLYGGRFDKGLIEGGTQDAAQFDNFMIDEEGE